MNIVFCILLITQIDSPFRQDEFMIDTSKVYHGAGYDQNEPAVAFNGTHYFVVWRDDRLLRRSDIFGTRVDPQGVVIDTPGIIIAVSDNVQRGPEVASDGNNFLVVWSMEKIYGTRINRDGVVLDTVPIQISQGESSQSAPVSLTFDGQNYFVVWYDRRNSGSIYGARLRPDGVVLDTAGIAIDTTPAFCKQPHVVFGDTNYFVVWTRDDSIGCNVYGARITSDGILLDTNGILITPDSAAQYRANISFGAGVYLVTWCDRRNGASDIYGARVQTDGAVIDTQGIAVDTSADSQRLPAVAFSGIDFLITYRSNINSERHIVAKRVASDGAVIDTFPITISDNADQIADHAPVIFDGTQHFVVWGNINSLIAYSDIYGARVSIDGTVIDPNGFLISCATTNQYGPYSAYDGSNYFVVWKEWWEDLANIRGARVDTSGVVLDPSGFSICPQQSYQTEPRLSFDGQNYLAIWREGRIWGDIWGARVNPAGVVLDTGGFPISINGTNFYYPAIAFGDLNYFVVWNSGNCILGSRVTTSGVSLDPFGIEIVRRNFSTRYPSIAFDGVNYLVTWSEGGNFPPDRVYCARVDTAGNTIDTIPMLIATHMRQYGIPYVTFGGENYLIVWSDERVGLDIYGARVDTLGVVLDSAGFRISYGSWESVPKVALDSGGNFFVVWTDYRNQKHDIYGCRVTPSGTVLDTAGIPIFISHHYFRACPFITFGSGQYLCVCQGFAEPPYSSERIFGILEPPVGVKEEIRLKKRLESYNLRVFPNPVYENLNIHYTLPQHTKVNLSIYDVAGRLVNTLINSIQNPGSYQQSFNTANLSQGVYFVRLHTSDKSIAEKVIFLK